MSNKIQLSEEEAAHYHWILSDFADLINVMGVEQVTHDFQKYHEKACNSLRGYFMDEE